MTRPAITYGIFQPAEAAKPLELVSPQPGVLEVRTIWRDQVTVMVTIVDPDVHIVTEWADGWIDNPSAWRNAIITAALAIYHRGETRLCED